MTSGAESLSFVSPHVLLRLLRLIAPALVVFAGLVAILYYQEVSKETALLENDAAHTADLQRDIMLRELAAVESDLLYLADQWLLREFVSGRGNRRDVEAEYVLFCKQRRSYDQVRYLDRSGMEVVRINYNGGSPVAVPASDLQPKTDRYYFREAIELERGQVFVSPFDLNVEHGVIDSPQKPVIRFATPVFDDLGEKRGMVVLNYLGVKLLAKLDEVAARSAGRFLLLNEQGYFLRGERAEHEWGFMLEHDTRFEQRFADEWPAIRDSQGGRFSTARGIFAFRTVPLGRDPKPTSDAATDAAAFERDFERLTIVAHVPAEVLVGRSARVLRLLLVVSGPALAVLALVSWYLAHAGAQREQHKQRIAESEARLRVLATRLLTAQEDERRRVARDLHDDVGQLATTLSLDLQRAVAAESDRRPERLERALRDAECLLERIHAIAARIRPSLLDDIGLKQAVQSYLAEYESRTGIAVSAAIGLDGRAIAPEVSENAFRILQEALHNVSKHAGVRDVTVSLVTSDESLRLSVHDQGVGFDPESTPGDRLGILGMRERAELLGGRFSLRTQPAGGTMIEVLLPLAPRPASLQT